MGKVKVNVKERVEDNTCDLSLSELSEVPLREIASFKRVTTVDLSSNKLITLGKNFASLTRLVKLDLSKNQIKHLPDDFGLLRNLRHLDLYDNQISHLPLSFGDLSQLRYLDLKQNKLVPAVSKIVGLCLTNKECQESARNTVKFYLRMQAEAEKEKAQFVQNAQSLMDGNSEETVVAGGDEKSTTDTQKSRKSNKKSKSKNKKSNSITEVPKEVNAETASAPLQQTNLSKAAKPKKSTSRNIADIKLSDSSTAFISILSFFLLLVINIVIIYVIMYKNPEMAKRIVESIPDQYRNWILTKTEMFGWHVSDWITEFRTTPEEH